MDRFSARPREPSNSARRSLSSTQPAVTGELLDTLALPGLTSDSAFAFAWWGGDFYLFHDPDDFGQSSDVWHLDYDESDGSGQALTKVVSPAPIRIVGAGVSTCVPAGPV